MSIKSISVISRNPDSTMRDSKHDIHKVQRNFNPLAHPFQEGREYKLALNAVKIERMLSKPFMGSLVHTETVNVMARHPDKLSCVYTGTVEGELYQWNLQTKQTEWKVQAHTGHVFSISADTEGDYFYTVGGDQTVKQWRSNYTNSVETVPLDTWLCDTPIAGISHNHSTNEFVTCGEKVYLWDVKSKEPKHSYDWSLGKFGYDSSVICIKFNPVEKNIFAATDYANNLILYDTRVKEVVNKVTMSLRLNAIDWNPMESFILAGASEDYNCYTFDIRNMDSTKRVAGIHRGHTSAVIDVNFSPTGKEFCSGSYDKSVRIFPTAQNQSRDIYYTKRMYRVSSVLWTGDDKYILSGSTDHNVRIWKARASEKLGLLGHRERASLDYQNQLKKKHIHFNEIKRIAKHRHLPKPIYHATQELKDIKQKELRKERNRKMNTKPENYVTKSAKDKVAATFQEDKIDIKDLLVDFKEHVPETSSEKADKKFKKSKKRKRAE